MRHAFTVLAVGVSLAAGFIAYPEMAPAEGDNAIFA